MGSLMCAVPILVVENSGNKGLLLMYDLYQNSESFILKGFKEGNSFIEFSQDGS